MVTARDEAAETMRRTDLVIEVLDARAPRASCNPLVESLRKKSHRPALKVLNRADQADPEQTRAWLGHYNAQPDMRAIAVSSKSAKEVGRIPKEAMALLPGRGTAAKPLRMMILGVPNVGKSTLMNALLKRRIAAVGDQPAITKMQVGHALGPGMWLIDTPGLLWPGMKQESAVKLAATYSIGRNAYDSQQVAVELGGYLLAHYPELVNKRFGVIDAAAGGHGLIEWVARSRGLLGKGGVLDLNKASVTLLDEFRAGTLGRITLETVEESAELP
jgi:ribosome biogenesis GTPase A